MSSDFITGADFSSILSEEESGVTWKNPEGTQQDLVQILRNAGVNYARVRVWNDPYNEDGKGYGAGNVGVDRAVQIGKRATDAGMKVLVDFHYSDFWPDGQNPPKAWKQYTSDPDKMAAAVKDFTTESLTKFKEAGVDVGMVQVGNESNSKITGITGTENMCKIYKAGSQAVRSVFPQAKVALHFNQNARASWADNFEQYGVDYDVWAMSYYAWGRTSLDSVVNVMKTVAKNHGKDVMIAETAWPYQIVDTDGYQNNYGPHNAERLTKYSVDEQGQANNIHDVSAALNGIGDNDNDGKNDGLGFFYWEPAWIAVGPADTPEQVEANRVKWRDYGSGWISEYAKGYYKNNWDGTSQGSGWDNMTLFDSKGNALGSLQSFNYIRTGAKAPHEFINVEPVSVTVKDGEEISLPETVTVKYKDGVNEQEAVTWSKALEHIHGPGTYSIAGTTASGREAKATVTVDARNYITNPGFEDTDMSAWTIESPNGNVLYRDTKNQVLAGKAALHYWSKTDYSFTATQTVTGLPAGTYTLSGSVVGEPLAEGYGITLSAGVNGQEQTMSLDPINEELTSTATIKDIVVGDNGTVTVKISGNMPGGSYGSFDEFSLVPTQNVKGDATVLNNALNDAKSVNRDDYTADSLAALDEAVEIGEVVLGGSTSTDEQIQQAADAITKAISGLQPAVTDTPVLVVDAGVRGDDVSSFFADAAKGGSLLNKKADQSYRAADGWGSLGGVKLRASEADDRDSDGLVATGRTLRYRFRLDAGSYSLQAGVAGFGSARSMSQKVAWAGGSVDGDVVSVEADGVATADAMSFSLDKPALVTFTLSRADDSSANPTLTWLQINKLNH